MDAHDHDHDHSELSETQRRVRALESVLTEKGYVDPAALDVLIETYETKVGPHNGARVVAKAWADPEYRARLFDDAAPRSRPLGFAGRQGENMVALENTPRGPQHGRLHALLLLPVARARACRRSGTSRAPYRSRAVSDPRGVLRDFGVELPAETEIRVWDSTAELRYLVVPMRPEGTEGWSEEELAALVTRDSMIGTGLAARPAGGRRVNGVHDMGGMHGFGPVDARARRARLPRRVGAPRVRAHARDGRDRRVEPRRLALRPRETGPPATYLVEHVLRDLARRRSSACSPSAAW